MITYWNAVGYIASGLVVTAFGMKGIVELRVVAMISNVAFFIYGVGLELTPVWLLHATLFPMNAWRLVHVLRSVHKGSTQGAPDRGSKRFASANLWTIWWSAVEQDRGGRQQDGLGPVDIHRNAMIAAAR